MYFSVYKFFFNKKVKIKNTKIKQNKTSGSSPWLNIKLTWGIFNKHYCPDLNSQKFWFNGSRIGLSLQYKIYQCSRTLPSMSYLEGWLKYPWLVPASRVYDLMGLRLLQNGPKEERDKILLPNGPPPFPGSPCTRFTLPSTRELWLSMPEFGEKKRNYLFKSYTDLE